MNLFNRKPPTTQAQQSSRFIAANAIQLLEQVGARILRDWDRGISIRYIAKDYEISVAQVEYLVWRERAKQHRPDPSAPAVTPKPFLVERIASQRRRAA